MKYTNVNIRKICKTDEIKGIVGFVVCAISILLMISGVTGAVKIKNEVKPINEILLGKGNHAAKPAFFEINEVPVKVGEDKHEGYYLVTNGYQYYISGMQEEEFATLQSELEKSESARLEGVTKVIIDDKVRERIAAALSLAFGKNIDSDTMDEYIGDVQIRVVPINTKAMIKEIYILNFAFGIPILLIGIIALFSGVRGIQSYSRIKSLKEITVEELDKELNENGAKWLGYFQIYLTKSFVVGSFKGITALRYDEMKHIYIADGENENLSVMAKVADGTEFVLAKVQALNTLENKMVEEISLLYDICKNRNADIICGRDVEKTENVYFTYPFYVWKTDSDGEEAEEEEFLTGKAAYEMLGDDMKDGISYDFKTSLLYRYFQYGQYVTDLTLEFKEDGTILICATVAEEQSDTIRDSLDSFLTHQLSDGWGEGFEGELYNGKDGETFSIAFWRYKER